MVKIKKKKINFLYFHFLVCFSSQANDFDKVISKLKFVFSNGNFLRSSRFFNFKNIEITNQ